MSEACIFCKIVRGEIPAQMVHEDEDLVAFRDIRPAAPVHLLIVPRRHIETLAACQPGDEALLGKMLVLAPRLAQQEGIGYAGRDGSGGFKTLVNTGPGGGQEVYHLHVHVLGGPRPWQRSL